MSNQSLLVAVDGQLPVSPILRVKPTVQRVTPDAQVGWRYRRPYVLTNNGPFAVFNHPFPINVGATNGLVTGSKLQADGDDLRVWRNGVEIPRTVNTINSATDGYVWVIIPFLDVGESANFDVMYGNANAGAPPALTDGVDAPPFDIITTGANRSTKLKWVTDLLAAGKGGWYGNPGTSQPADINFGMPGSWAPDTILPSIDDSRQGAYRAVSASDYRMMFDARRARAEALVLTENTGTDGVSIRVGTGIASVKVGLKWTNQAIGDTDVTPIGKVSILYQASDGSQWVPFQEWTTLQATEATIAVATYTPPGQPQAIAFAVLPQDGIQIDPAARADRYVDARWDTTLELNLDDSIAQSGGVEVEVYELATELRYGGGADTVGIPPYKSIKLGNVAQTDAAGTKRLAVELNQYVVIDTERKTAEVWNSGLTAKVSDVHDDAIDGYDGVLLLDGTTEERPSAEWMPLVPVVNPLANPSALTDVTGWTASTTDAGLTVSALARDAAVFSDAAGSFTRTVNPNTSGIGASFYTRITDFIPVGGSENMSISGSFRTANTNIVPRFYSRFYAADQSTVVGSDVSQATPAAFTINTWFRRLFAADVPVGAIYWQPMVRWTMLTAGPTGQVWWDDVRIGDTEIALLDVNRGANGGALTLEYQLQNRYVIA